MPASPAQIQELVDNPRESLAIELKDWFDPRTPEGQAKVIKSCVAMRNRGDGGFVMVGFDNRTAAPNTSAPLADVRDAFHPDTINHLVNHHASERFEVHVHFGRRDGVDFPVLEVEAGARTLVAIRRPVAAADGTELVCTNDVYVRSLSHNNTPSTGKPRWDTWEDILDPLFTNREGDLIDLLRRYLTPEQNRELARRAGEAGSRRGEGEPPPEIEVHNFLNYGYDRYQTQQRQRDLGRMPRHGWWEVAVVAEGEVDGGPATEEFLNLIAAANPSYTGWPLWIDSRGFSNKGEDPSLDPRPRVFERGWEAFVYRHEPGSWYNHLDFWRAEPAGRFYALRGLEDDISEGAGYPESMTTLDFGLAILRTAEAIAVPMAFARAMGLSQEETMLRYLFRWSGLRDRELSSWTDRGRFVGPGYVCHQHEVFSPVLALPLETPTSAIAPFVRAATDELFAAFGGFEPGPSVVEDLTKRLLTRNL
jgi:hypothetical protein